MTLKYRVVILLSCFLLNFTACQSAKKPVSQEIYEIEPVSFSAQTLTEAISISSGVISDSLDSGLSIAVISINSGSFIESEYAMQELTFNLVKTQKFTIVDRQNLYAIRNEQQLHLSGEVSDETAVSIGHLIGAAYVITGNISLWDSSNILRIRVLNVETGEIKAMSSVHYGGN